MAYLSDISIHRKLGDNCVVSYTMDLGKFNSIDLGRLLNSIDQSNPCGKALLMRKSLHHFLVQYSNE